MSVVLARTCRGRTSRVRYLAWQRQRSGGIRAAITTRATSLAALQAAVQTVATIVAVPLNHRAPLIGLLGNDLELTAQLLASPEPEVGHAIAEALLELDYQ